MSYRLFIEVSAEKDIEEAFLWIADESRSSAIKWYRELVEAIETLKMFPQRCPLAPENDTFEEEIRQLLYGKRRGIYRVLFIIREMNVHILHLRHCAQEPLD